MVQQITTIDQSHSRQSE